MTGLALAWRPQQDLVTRWGGPVINDKRIVYVGPPGGAGASYNHVQSSPSTVWTINHNLGFRPIIETFTVGGQLIVGSVLHVSNNQVTVSFNNAIAGTARLN